ncbi:glycosyltransferase, partial [uncultured Alteromonas sp.]|uniref:glycosyltransferase n=1 Tax=uncultured Alteromonas sp. TaxID=179113 RepID=UPI0030D478CE
SGSSIKRENRTTTLKNSGIGLFILSGKEIKSDSITSFNSLEDAIRWKGTGKLILCTSDDESALERVSAFDTDFFLWLHVHLNHRLIEQLERFVFQKLICVSDTVRLTGLHSFRSNELIRIYNPLSPHFIASHKNTVSSRERKSIVFSGFIGENKGIQHLLLLWPKIKEYNKEFKLYVAGSGKLYDTNAKLGEFGVASAKFETLYLVPLIEKFGSFDNADIYFLGSLKPHDLRALYQKCAIGVVNLNQWESTETFCCTGVEMVASGLQVLCLKRGALQETLGVFSLVNLICVNDLVNLPEILESMSNQEVSEATRARDLHLIKKRYALNTICEEWRRLLRGDEVFALQEWNSSKGKRYYTERLFGLLKLSRLYRSVIRLLKH